SGALFATDDLRGAVRSFLDVGPGKAVYSGK
ncbi:MAG: enoyl-CoA hydratase/isomerase family protein, partial [Rhodococcus sp. (in: high G+C Gram-positive bacteria)]|nr:enoyl-CoA hydratase/isomerase family protein [Rhodococcus sp. (in: high G+C Gram-positive bacteria)]